jgi:hypothetical protein
VAVRATQVAGTFAISTKQPEFAPFDFMTRKWTDLIVSPDKFTNWAASPDR